MSAKICFCCCSVTHSCLTLCDPMDCNMPGCPVHHQLLKFTQTHVLWVCDVIQPSHPPSPSSPLAFNLSQHQGLFQWVISSHQVGQSFGASALVSVLPMSIQGWFSLGLIGLIAFLSKGFSQESSLAPQFKGINSSLLIICFIMFYYFFKLWMPKNAELFYL